jgi:endothelin-converting enzyme/putative endopeptidase
MKIAIRLSAPMLWLVLAVPAAAQSQAEPALPYSPSLNLSSIDKSVDPCVNFYQYACGRWQKDNPIPSDQTSWSVYGKLYQDNLNFLRGILDQAAKSSATRDTVTQEVYALDFEEP